MLQNSCTTTWLVGCSVNRSADLGFVVFWVFFGGIFLVVVFVCVGVFFVWGGGGLRVEEGTMGWRGGGVRFGIWLGVWAVLSTTPHPRPNDNAWLVFCEPKCRYLVCLFVFVIFVPGQGGVCKCLDVRVSLIALHPRWCSVI